MSSILIRRGCGLLATVLVSLSLLAGTADAQIIENRQGDANPMVSVFKSTIYGGLAGLVLGLAIELVDEDSDGDAVKWGFVGGTFFGFGYGIYHVANRPGPSGALLERGPAGWEWTVPDPVLVMRDPDPRLARSPVAALATDTTPGVDAALVRWNF